MKRPKTDNRRQSALRDELVALPKASWTREDGNVLWWTFHDGKVLNGPFVGWGDSLDGLAIEYTHWTPIVRPLIARD